MSIDFYLELDQVVTTITDKTIPVRIEGSTKMVTAEEYNRMFPDREPISANPIQETTTVFEANITHNLGKMAGEAGIYECLWRPNQYGYEKANDIIELLEDGINLLMAKPEHFKQFNASNGWGTYEGLISFAENVLNACKNYPHATIRVWR